MIVADMVLDLVQKHVEVWTHAKTDGPTFDGKLVNIAIVARPNEDAPDAASFVGWLGLLDERGLHIRVASVAVSAVVSRA